MMMKIRNLPTQLLLTVMTSVIAGAAIGIACTSLVADQKITQARQSEKAALARLADLAASAEKQNSAKTNIPDSPPASMPGSSEPANFSGTLAATKSRAEVKPAIPSNPAESWALRPRAIPRPPVADLPPPASVIPASTQPAQRPTINEAPVTQPGAEPKIEAVSASKAGVVKIDHDAVVLTSGTRVAVGEKFPSGETLLRVDSANMRLVTDRRQLILFGGKE